MSLLGRRMSRDEDRLAWITARWPKGVAIRCRARRRRAHDERKCEMCITHQAMVACYERLTARTEIRMTTPRDIDIPAMIVFRSW